MTEPYCPVVRPELPLDPRRLEKARAILASGGVSRLDDHTWQVASQTGSGYHLVTRQGEGLEGLECSCADFMGRNYPEMGVQAPCKHCLAVVLAEGLIESEQPPAGEYDEEVEEEIQEVTSRLQADGLLWQIGQLGGELQEIRNLARHEIEQIQWWEEGETRRLQECIGRLSTALEGFLRRQDRKTLHLPHGALKLRAQPPRVNIVDLAAFPLDREELVRIVPEQRLPDKRKIRAHLEATGEIPPGVEIEAPEPRFSFTTRTATPKEVNVDEETPLAEAAG